MKFEEAVKEMEKGKIYHFSTLGNKYRIEGRELQYKNNLVGDWTKITNPLSTYFGDGWERIGHTLSDKEIGAGKAGPAYKLEDVKETIKRIKERIETEDENIELIMDEELGDKLTKG